MYSCRAAPSASESVRTLPWLASLHVLFGVKPGTFNSIGVSTRERINEFSIVVDVFVSVTMLVQVEVAFPFICYDQGSPMDLLDDGPHECVVAPFIIFAFHHEQLSVTLLKYPLSDDSFTPHFSFAYVKSVKKCLKNVKKRSKASKTCPKSVQKAPESVQKVSKKCPKSAQKASKKRLKSVQKGSKKRPKSVQKAPKKRLKSVQKVSKSGQKRQKSVQLHLKASKKWQRAAKNEFNGPSTDSCFQAHYPA